MSNANENATKALADSLNGLLADSYALFIKTKNFHWHVDGPHFRDYHLMLDEHAQEIIGITDAMAERVRKIGHRSLTSIGSISNKQSISDNDEAHVDAQAMLKELHDDNMTLVKGFKSAKELAEAAGDNATDGLLDDWTDQAEERAWFLRETIK